jgi:hypothetical protein
MNFFFHFSDPTINDEYQKVSSSQRKTIYEISFFVIISEVIDNINDDDD